MKQSRQHLGTVKDWALQTVIFALSIKDEHTLPLEVSEQKITRARNIVDRIFQQAADTGRFPHVFTDMVLDWVAANWPKNDKAV